jgi:hypothetical protein
MIDPKSITENARVICNFLELTINDKRAKKNPEYRIPFSNIPCLDYEPCGDECSDAFLEVDKDVYASETLFHKDWHWIMQVVDKIEQTKVTHESIGETTISFDTNLCSLRLLYHGGMLNYLYGRTKLFNGQHITLMFNDPAMDDHEHYCDSKLEAYYKACLEFIHWYNDK